MIIVAYFVDGPYHGYHSELQSALPEVHMPKGSGIARQVHIPPPIDMDAVMTLELGSYKRDREPKLSTARVVVFGYKWMGWQ